MIGLWPNVRALPEILPFGPDTILPLAGSIDVLPPKKVDGFSVIVMPFTVTWVIFLNTVNSSQSTIKVHRGLAVGVDVMGDLLGLSDGLADVLEVFRNAARTGAHTCVLIRQEQYLRRSHEVLRIGSAQHRRSL